MICGPQRGRNLLGKEAVAKQVEPAARNTGGRRSRRLELDEAVLVGEIVRERCFTLDPPLLVLLARLDVHVPPHPGDIGLERRELALDTIGDCGWITHARQSRCRRRSTALSSCVRKRHN